MGIEVGRGTFVSQRTDVALQETLGNGTKHLPQSRLLSKARELGAAVCTWSEETAL